LCFANNCLSILISEHWILLYVPRAALCVRGWRVGGALSTGLSGYNTDSLTMEHCGNILGECHAPYKLNISYTEFEKELLHRFRYKRLVFRSYPTLHTFWVASNVVGPVHPSIPYFFNGYKKMRYHLAECCHSVIVLLSSE
jgi:hypothetical protein